MQFSFLRRPAFLLVGMSVFACAMDERQVVPGVRVRADFQRSGESIARGPEEPTSARGFVVIAPLPTRDASRDALPEPGDASDDVVERLGRLRVDAEPGSRVTLSTTGGAAVSIFRRTDARWTRASADGDATWTFAVDDSGVLEVGVGVAFPQAPPAADAASWPSAFSVSVRPTSGAEPPIDVPFRVAPFLIPSALDPVEQLWIVGQDRTSAAVADLERFAADAKVDLVVHRSMPRSDQWMQDTIEPGVFAYPARGSVREARTALVGIRREMRASAATLDREIEERLSTEGAVLVSAGASRKNTRWIDWYGNLEVTPPHTDRTGRRFPYGRVLTGKQGDLGMHPAVMAFLEAQGLQWPPIEVDTSWLIIGHVDEVVNFVPARNRSGFKVLLPSPQAARNLLDDLVARGLGGAPVFENSRDAMTVLELRDRIAASDENRSIDATIAAIRAQLRSELELDEDDFVLLPVLFERGGAVIPNAVNCIVADGHVVATDPRGPRHDGKDVFQEAIRQALSGCDVDVAFVDAWDAYHSMGGEVHCGTNAFRRLADPAWWNHVDALGLDAPTRPNAPNSE